MWFFKVFRIGIFVDIVTGVVITFFIGRLGVECVLCIIPITSAAIVLLCTILYFFFVKITIDAVWIEGTLDIV
jgi:hypothetical protein